MSQFVSQSELKISPPSFPFAFSLKDLQEVLKEFTLDIIEEVRNAKRIIVSDLLEKDRIMREDIWFAVRRVNYKMDETTENEERLDFNMEELVNTEATQEELTISQNECIGGLEEEKLQVYSKKFFTKDPSFNLERKSGEVGKEIEKFLKETSLKVSRRRKDLAFLFEVLKRQDSRGNIVIGTAANYDGTRRRLITALQAKDLSILKMGMDETTENEERLDFNMEEFLKETSLKVLRRRKDFAFLFDVLKCQVSRGDIVIGIVVNYDGICRRLITALQVKDLSILKMGSPSSPYMEQEEWVV